ncbi:MAG: archaellin/type IV pilin N-terminal domain-containing protein [Candidatus Micrarchaeia archaeon]
MRFDKNTKRGAVGIGTLIIFIAMVLVAAIAAAVLINVSGILQQRAMTTGKESIAQVSSNLIVTGITGYTDDNRTNIENISIYITAASGAGRLDLRYLIMKVGNNINETPQRYSNVSSGDSNFTAQVLRDPANLFTPNNPVIDSTSLIELKIIPSNDTTFVSLPPRSPFHIELIPERGAPLVIDTMTPSTYATNIQHLYP